jgi:hypothetical protein
VSGIDVFESEALIFDVWGAWLRCCGIGRDILPTYLSTYLPTYLRSGILSDGDSEMNEIDSLDGERTCLESQPTQDFSMSPSTAAHCHRCHEPNRPTLIGMTKPMLFQKPTASMRLLDCPKLRVSKISRDGS